MPRRKITTWAKISQMVREHYPEEFDAAAIAMREAFEAAEIAEYAEV